jgi:hypothetical protein
MEAVMFEDRDAPDHCSNGLTAKRYREATEEERATYRKWMRGIIAFYGVLVLATGLLAAANYSGAGFTQLTNLSVRPIATPARTD